MIAEGGLIIYTALMHVLVGRGFVDVGELVLSGAASLSSDATRSSLIAWA